jgi:dTDP-4-amino-4,6-dideoxygalactose transaminase
MMGIAQQHGLFVIKEACQARGFRYKGNLQSPWAMRDDLAFIPVRIPVHLG